MAYPGPSVGPWQIAEVDIHLINEIFRQIEENIDLLRGLRNDALSATGTTVGIVLHTHEDSLNGGNISHDDALDDVSSDDHHAAFIGLKSDGSNVNPTSQRINLISGSGVTLTPAAGQITIASTGAASSLTVTEEDNSPSVSSVTEIRVTNGTLTDNGSGSVSIDIGSGSACDVQWSVLASAAALIFDSNGDVLMTELCQPSSCCP